MEPPSVGMRKGKDGAGLRKKIQEFCGDHMEYEMSVEAVAGCKYLVLQREILA